MYFLFVDWKPYSKLCSCGICFYYGVQWPKEAWILGQDVSAGFTPSMYIILFPHFWLPLCALLHTTASHPLPIAAICNFSNCIVILFLGFPLNVIVSYTLHLLLVDNLLNSLWDWHYWFLSWHDPCAFPRGLFRCEVSWIDKMIQI